MRATLVRYAALADHIDLGATYIRKLETKVSYGASYAASVSTRRALHISGTRGESAGSRRNTRHKPNWRRHGPNGFSYER